MLFISDKIRKHLTGQDDAPSSETDIRSLLKKAGLRSTRQRIALGNLLFQGGHRHITADDLHTAMIRAGVPLSLATVYNALNQFTSAGLLRKINIAGEQAYYDTDPQSHQHFYIEAEQKIINIPAGTIHFKELPAPPEGYAISNIEVIIQLRRIG